MANSLYPVFEVPEIAVKQPAAEKNYPGGFAFSDDDGDFARDGANKLVRCGGREAYRRWCCKVVHIERGAFLAYPLNIGVEAESALKMPTRAATESALELTITEALTVNPRTEYVRGFEFKWSGDNLHCSCIVKGQDWQEFTLDIDYAREGR